MSEEKSGKSEGAKKTTASNEVNFEQMSIQEGSSTEIKGIDANRYATKKTVAQGLLDIALLTSNASQLKYILQVGSKHEFYTLLITLITISIILQVSAGILALITSSLNADSHKKITNWLNQISVGLMTGVIFCDVIKMNFGLDPALSEHDYLKKY
ncbi:ninjurin-2 isoform X2 [Pieris brassicae]|uniref:ninjurin-2 isoform X2 n=1 Tax=Pieris brassicae TaxID=7116 RepID=UPI001E65EAFF|nr:ninjurin-2 isoform X2 [Pieris brassicae]